MISNAKTDKAETNEFDPGEFRVVRVRRHLRLWTLRRADVRDEVEAERLRLLEEARSRVRWNSNLLLQP